MSEELKNCPFCGTTPAKDSMNNVWCNNDKCPIVGDSFSGGVRHWNTRAPVAEQFQQRVQPWMMECFGAEIAADRQERNHRFLEESLELVQSTGCTASEAHQLVDYVFGRPVGEPVQEVGGVMVTLAALCLANELHMHAAGETELSRIWTRVNQIRAKQAAKPKHSPLPETISEQSKRGTDEQILFERQLTCDAIDGAMASGGMNSNPPPDDSHWLAPYWKIGRQLAVTQVQQDEPLCWTLQKTIDEAETTTTARLWFSDPQSAAWIPLYTRPQPLRALTDEEIDSITGDDDVWRNKDSMRSFARAILAAAGAVPVPQMPELTDELLVSMQEAILSVPKNSCMEDCRQAKAAYEAIKGATHE